MTARLQLIPEHTTHHFVRGIHRQVGTNNDLLELEERVEMLPDYGLASGRQRVCVSCVILSSQHYKHGERLWPPAWRRE